MNLLIKNFTVAIMQILFKFHAGEIEYEAPSESTYNTEEDLR